MSRSELMPDFSCEIGIVEFLHPSYRIKLDEKRHICLVIYNVQSETLPQIRRLNELLKPPIRPHRMTINLI